MSASVGSLSIEVQLALSKMDAQFKDLQGKVRNNTSQMRRQFKALATDANRDLSSIGRGPSGGGSSIGGKIGGKLAGDALGNLSGLGGRGGDILAGGLGRGGLLVGGIAGMAKFQGMIVDIARASKELDDSTLAVIRYGDTWKQVGENTKGFFKTLAVDLMGSFNQLGELIALGGDQKLLDAVNAADRANIEQARKKAEFEAINPSDKLASIRERIRQFQRDQEFASVGPSGQMSILKGEIGDLANQERAARVEQRILDAETLRLDRMQKIAELRGIEKDFAAKQLDIENRINEQRADLRQKMADAAAEKKREDAKAAEVKAEFLSGLTLASFSAGIGRSASSSGGTYANGSAEIGRATNKTLLEMLETLKDIAEAQYKP